MAFEPDIPTIGTLVQRATADVNAELGADSALIDTSDEHVLAAVSAGLAFHCYGTLRNVAKNVVPSADNDETALAEHARFWLGNEDGRRDAAPATLPIVDDGSSVADTEIPAGTRWRGSDGALYENIELLVYGTDEIVVQSIAAEGEVGYGAGGNRVPGSVLTLVTEVPGLASSWEVDGDPADGPIGGGADQETLEALADRVEFAAQNPPGGGKSSDYVLWAREVAGVGKAWAYPRLRGPGTVDVFFTRADTTNPIPDVSLVANVQAHLDEMSPITVGVVFATAPVAAATPISIAIKPNNAATQAAVTAALRDAFLANAQPGNGTTIYFDRSWLTAAASSAVGELGHTLTVPAADFTPALGQLPTLGAITFSTKA
jgi:uncharacterized phage protein gp47/JayE